MLGACTAAITPTLAVAVAMTVVRQADDRHLVKDTCANRRSYQIHILFGLESVSDIMSASTHMTPPVCQITSADHLCTQQT